MQLNRFSDFSEEQKPLDGNKIKLEEVLDKEIKIIGFHFRHSKYSENGSKKCLTLQFELDGQRRVLFTGSQVLIEQLEKYGQKIPFLAIIKKIDRYYTLS